MTDALSRQYAEFYRARAGEALYPVEFVVRAFLGRYPRLTRPVPDYRGKTALDLGCGDGRNMPLLSNLGMTVHGVEIAQEICDATRDRLGRLGVTAELRVGRNHQIPYEDGSFDYVLASHACYYVDPGTTFDDNIQEIARVTRQGGVFVFSAPMESTYILRGSDDAGDGHRIIRNDPYGVRNGVIMKAFASPDAIEQALAPRFGGAAIGSCRNDFWGIDERVWIVVCERR